jgi:hypothetical protein
MSDKPLPFVITDRRKFTSEGEARPDADPSPEREHREPPPPPTPISVVPEPEPAPAESDLPPAPTAEQMEQSRVAFAATAERLDLAIRAANPGAEHPPALSFESLIQSVYMQAILQLGGGTPEGQQPQVDLLGARQSIDMLGILDTKSQGNLNESEQGLVHSAIFELRLAYLEITQALSRSAQQRAQQAPGATTPAGKPGPSLIR